jgi:AraC-like DNA-binding protein
MEGLESNSPSSPGCWDRPRSAHSRPEAARLKHAPCERLPRHPHRAAFAAVVLSGGYVEAGDTGRHRLGPGDVLLHRAFEQHLDRFDSGGAEVLVLTLDGRAGPLQAGRIADPDALARLAERDAGAAAQTLLAELQPRPVAASDWPDLLALAIRADPALPLADWAETAGLHAGSVSRGFRQVFGVTPAAYRLAQRTQQALDAVLHTRTPLSAIAQDCGFADQAHMARAIRTATHFTPGALRREAD